jgi:hypothetical protein
MRFWLPDVLCPSCGAQERQRFLALYLDEKDETFAVREGTVLHFAPEAQVRAIVSKNARLHSLHSDLDFNAMRAENCHGPGMAHDLEALGIGSETVDVVFACMCSSMCGATPNPFAKSTVCCVQAAWPILWCLSI